MTFWRRWVRRPQELGLRKVLFQIHLWTGIGAGVYVLVICVSGSVLVYRNELYRTFQPRPTVVTGSGESMTVEDLKSIAHRAYPGYEVTDVRRGETANHAVEIALKRGKAMKRRLLHPFTGEDLGDPMPAGFRLTAWLLDLHDNGNRSTLPLVERFLAKSPFQRCHGGLYTRTIDRGNCRLAAMEITHLDSNRFGGDLL